MNRIKSKHIVPTRYLILCEGETEVRYFKSYRLANENRDRLRGVEIEIRKPDNHSPVGLVREAKALLREAKRDKFPYHEVWIVFDRDGHANIPNAFEEARNAGINIAFSAVCFEYWILLHFEKRKISFQKGDDIVQYLKHNCITNYCKGKVGFNELKSSLDKALKNADWLHNQHVSDIENGRRVYELDPYTNVDKLMHL